MKAHADTLKRKSTEDEKGNQTVDKLAEDAYHKLEDPPVGENGVINQNTFDTVGAHKLNERREKQNSNPNSRGKTQTK